MECIEFIQRHEIQVRYRKETDKAGVKAFVDPNTIEKFKMIMESRISVYYQNQSHECAFVLVLWVY